MVDRRTARSDRSTVPTIRELIRTALDAGKSVRDLEADSGFRVKHQTFQELSNRAPKQFPKSPETIEGMSLALRCPETTIVLAYAQGLGIDVSVESDFALRLPPGVDDLGADMKNALVSVVRAAVNQNGATHAEPQPTPAPAAAEPRAPGETSEDQEARREFAEEMVRVLDTQIVVLTLIHADPGSNLAHRNAFADIRAGFEGISQGVDDMLAELGANDIEVAGEIARRRAVLKHMLDQTEPIAAQWALTQPHTDSSSPGVACIGDSGDSSANPSTDHWSGGQTADELAKRRPPPADLDDTPPSIEFADAARNEPGHVKAGDRVKHLDEDGLED